MGNREKDKIKVTVTMPVYNAAICVEEAIQSVLSQKYDKFELLIVDDGSTDNSFEIIKKYKNHSKVRIYRNKDNLGGGKTRNKSISLAKGNYISFCDHDDIMLPDNIKYLSSYLDKHSKVGVVYSNVIVLEVNKVNKLIKMPYVGAIDINKSWDLIKNPIPIGGSMVRKSLVSRINGFNEQSYYAPVDRDFWLRLAENTKIKYLDGGVYYMVIRRPKKISLKSKKKYELYSRKIIKETIKRRYGIEFNFLEN